MSRIYFHSAHGSAELLGSERAYMGVVCRNLMLGILDSLGDVTRWLPPLLPPDHYALVNPDRLKENLRLFLSVPDDPIALDGNEIDIWIVWLNTALALGADPLRLMARLHGQCEVHCWVDGANRRWLAGIIRAGLECGLYRVNVGWSEVADFLESRDDGPVVCSYSVCDSFPNFDMLPADHPLMTREDEDRFDDFDDLTADEQWSLCVAGLRERESAGLELHPDVWKWPDYYFDGGLTAMKLAASAQAKAA